MSRLDGATKLCAHRTLITNHIGPRAAQACGTHGLVGIHHDVVFGSFGDGIVVVVDGGLRVMIVAVGNDLTDIATLHGIISVLIHQLISLLHPPLVVLRR